MSKITLRKLKPEDKKLFTKWWRDPELIKMTSGILDLITDDEVEKYFSMMLFSAKNYHFIVCLGKRSIGHISLAQRDNEWYETQIVIGEKEYWGKGFATEAMLLLLKKAEQLNIKEIFLEVRPDNNPAIRVYEKCGFVRKELIKYPENKCLPKTLRMEYQT